MMESDMLTHNIMIPNGMAAESPRYVDEACRHIMDKLSHAVLDKIAMGPCVCELMEALAEEKPEFSSIKITQSIRVTPIVKCGECTYAQDDCLGIPSSDFYNVINEVWCPKTNNWKMKHGFCDLGKRKENKQ